jgi:hypothetical protein
MPLHERFEGLELHPELAFVVDGAASVDIAVALGRLEWRADPLVERVGRLDIVMCVAESRGLAGGVKPVGVNQRMPRSGNDLDILKPNALEIRSDKFGRSTDVALVILQGADAGDAQQILKLVEEARLILLGVVDGSGSHRTS